MLLRLRYCASNLTKPRPFPYEFGRNKSHQVASQLHNIFMSQSFGQDVFKGFEHAYRNIIEAFNDKDKAYLEGIFEPNLLNNLTFPNTKLVNSNSSVETSLIRNQLIFGVSFNRQTFPAYKNVRRQSIDSDLFKYTIYMPSSFSPGLLKSTPIFRTLIEIRSKYKLIREGEAQDQKAQTHLLQFETSSKQQNFDVMELMSYMQAGFQNKTNTDSAEFIRKLIGKQFNWMVSDFDEYLSGNQWD